MADESDSSDEQPTRPGDPRFSDTPGFPDTPEEMTGMVIGPYQLMQKIGEGGFGSVWMARQREPIKRRVALKLIKLGMDTRSDIYSLGILLYELVAGATPFDFDLLSQLGYSEMMRVLKETEFPRPSTRFSTLGPNAWRAASLRRADVRDLKRTPRAGQGHPGHGGTRTGHRLSGESARENRRPADG